ncbi:MAG: outer membrane lipoprotein-sorting protein [Candidatus Azobacteroides sp.]|nr:outer membrane lipoprotein-sorting protein [Candidatus Azobacteroides sp.]
MKRLIFCLFSLGLSITLSAQTLSVLDIVKKADSKMRGESSYSEMTMTIVRPTWQRSISMKIWTKGTHFALIKVTAPAKDKGTGFVKRDKELWNWIPSIDRLIKMSASVMGQSWMGSDFTNDDMVRESSMVTDYTQKMAGEEEIRGFNCYQIELTPLPEAAVVWGKVIVWIEKETFNMIRTQNLDENFNLAQTLENYDFKQFGDRTLPSRREMTPAAGKEQKTVITISKAQYNIPIQESFFSQQNLKTIQ